VTAALIVAAVCLVLEALFSGSEVAVVAADRLRATIDRDYWFAFGPTNVAIHGYGWPPSWATPSTLSARPRTWTTPPYLQSWPSAAPRT